VLSLKNAGFVFWKWVRLVKLVYLALIAAFCRKIPFGIA
jgi:hypothetical protein